MSLANPPPLASLSACRFALAINFIYTRIAVALYMTANILTGTRFGRGGCHNGTSLG